MPRRPRLTLAGVPTHLVQRGVDRQACFFTDEDRSFYLELLAEHSRDAHCAVHAFVLMSNHVHLLLTPETDDGMVEQRRELELPVLCCLTYALEAG